MNLGKWFGIPTRIHWTFWLLPAWIFFTSLGSGASAAVVMVMLVFAIFGCVLLHELGHALAARKFGIGTRSIVLYPIGGIASLERIPRKPLQEFWIAVAGPLVNVVIAAILGVVLFAVDSSANSAMGAFLWRLMLTNIVLVVFNMLPAFPLDGGRVLRSLLALPFDYATASRIAVTIGRVVAIGLGILAIWSGNFMLLFIAGFIFLAGQAELNGLWRGYPTAQLNPSYAAGHSPVDMSDSNIECEVPSTLPVESVVAWLNELRSETCRVVQAGQILGKISKSQLIVAVGNGFGRTPIGLLLQ